MARIVEKDAKICYFNTELNDIFACDRRCRNCSENVPERYFSGGDRKRNSDLKKAGCTQPVPPKEERLRTAGFCRRRASFTQLNSSRKKAGCAQPVLPEEERLFTVGSTGRGEASHSGLLPEENGISRTGGLL